MSRYELHIVADENMPGLDEFAAVFGSIQKVASAHIDRRHLDYSDVLLVRSVTRVNAELLEGTPVRFVGSATAGTDHVDREYLSRSGIEFAHAPGSNAVSVVEYVLAAAAVLGCRTGRNLRTMTAGIVGCGQVGGRLAQRFEAMGMRVLRNDPPRAAVEEGTFVGLDVLLEESDIVSLHTPLTLDGPHRTHHLIGADELRLMKPDAWLINSSRGAVVASEDLRPAMQDGRLGAVVLDVWEHEPHVDRDLMRLVDIATPHIAGYSYDAKLAGTRQVMAALLDYLDISRTELPNESPDPLVLLPPDPAMPFEEAMRYVIDQAYDIVGDDRRMRGAVEAAESVPVAFHELRRSYPRRFSFGRYALQPHMLVRSLSPTIRDGLGVLIMPESGSVAERP